MARFNWVANKICLVWHEFESGSTYTDMYYTAISSYGLQPKVRINDATNNSQFMPALDFDAQGDVIVTFYDRRNEYDPNKKRYELYMAKIDTDGNLREPNQRISPFQSDPDFYTDSTGRAKFVGDYRDMWIESFSGTEYYLPVWIGIPYFGDAYISLIHP